MVELTNQTAFGHLLCSVRNKLWLDNLRKQLLLSCKISSGLLLLCGLMNLFVCQTPWIVVLSTLTLPMGSGLFACYLQKPSFAYAAAYSDQLFTGKSLMTTALDLLTRGETTDNNYSPWIIRQAEQTAPHWQEKFNHLGKQQSRQIPWFVLLIGVLGVFLILQPGKFEDSVFPENDGNQANPAEWHKTETPPPQSVVEEALLDAVRKEAASSAPEVIPFAETESEPFSTDNQASPRTDKNSDQQEATTPVAAKIANDSSESATQANQQAGAANAETAKPNRKPNDPAATKELPIKWVNIDLQDGATINSDEKGFPFKHAETLQKSAVTPAKVQSAQKHAGVYTTEFSFTQQQLVAAYFQHIK